MIELTDEEKKKLAEEENMWPSDPKVYRKIEERLIKAEEEAKQKIPNK